jgi:alpha-methylacyl-CoA racemase
MAFHVDQYLATEDEPAPDTAMITGRYAFYDFYQARDGKWLAVGAVEPHFYANLCRELGCEQWIAHQLDDDVQDDIRAAFRDAFATRDRDEWVTHLAPRDTCVGPAYAISEVVDDPHFAERAAFVRAQHPDHGEFRQVAPLLPGADRSVEVFALAAEGHTDTDAVLAAAGMTESEIVALREAGVVE